MTHICLLYTPHHRAFAGQLARHLGQRGLVVWPVPQTPGDEPPAPASAADPGVAEASHALVIVPPEDDPTPELIREWSEALAKTKHVIVIRCPACAVPAPFKKKPEVDFRGPFLLAVEELVERLEKTGAPTRPLTVEHPPPIATPKLLPIKLPAERCWREDRLRINYNLPIVLSRDDLELRLPAFLVQAGFEMTRNTRKQIVARRLRKRYRLFDPRRAIHTLTVRRRKGRIRIYYRMTRLQVYHWLPAQYRVLDREAAALYRYLVTGTLDGVFDPVRRQAARAQRISWLLLVGLIAALVVLVYLVAW